MRIERCAEAGVPISQDAALEMQPLLSKAAPARSLPSPGQSA